MGNKENGKIIKSLEPIAIQGSTELVALPSTESESDKRIKRHPIDAVLAEFLEDIRSIQKTHMVVLPHVLSWLRGQHESNAKKLTKYKSQSEDEAEVYRATSAHQASEMLKAIRELDGLGGMRIPETLQRSLFTQLFSEYDAFVGALLKVIYKRKTDLLKGISRQITFVDLIAYDDINAIKLDMLEKEVETFRRDSYVEQFATLESKFSLKLRSFDEWGEFVELSQRRNLIVHNGGVVSDQYLLVCDREGFKFKERPKLGDVLKPDAQYFSRATVVVSKVAFMLCHTLWRKIFPSEQETAHESANETLYDLLRDKRWKTANEIAKFGLTDRMKDGISDIELRLRTVNAAIAAKFSGDQVACNTILQSLDWSAAYRDFRLAIAVLNDDFISAAGMMKAIGRNGELVVELSYHDWPLFHKFKESPEFLEAYMAIYGVSYLAEAVRHKTEEAQSSQAEFDRGMETLDVHSKEVKAEVAMETPVKKVSRPKRVRVAVSKSEANPTT